MRRNYLTPTERDCSKCKANFSVDVYQALGSNTWRIVCKKCGKVYARGATKEEAIQNMRETLKTVFYKI